VSINIFRPSNFPLWIKVLNFGSLVGIAFYPFVFIACYARIGDNNFYQPTKSEYLIIFTYPFLLLLVSFFSYKVFRVSKMISGILPLAVILYYIYLLSSGILFEIRYD